MVIAIGTNGDGVLHWCHYVHHHWSQWIAIGTIFCRHWRRWRKPQIVMTLLPKFPTSPGYALQYQCSNTEHKKKIYLIQNVAQLTLDKYLVYH